MWRGYAVLKYTIEKFASVPVEIVEMSHATPDTRWHDWNMGRELGQPATRNKGPNGEAVWFTDFTNFRWAIPEASGFKGRAIYLDLDMILFDDIKELWELDMEGKAVLTLTPNETSVMLFDCEQFNNNWWPGLADMKTNGHNIQYYLRMLRNKDFFGYLPTKWNCLDGRNNSFVPGYTKLVHYTAMNTQPWVPYPELIRYPRHPILDLETEWANFYKAALSEGYIPDEAPLAGKLPEGVVDLFVERLKNYEEEAKADKR